MPETNFPKPRILQHDFEGGSDIVSWFQTKDASDSFSDIPQLPETLTTGTTVAICTYKRAASLKRALDSIAIQDDRPSQLIIVDASPDQDTETVVREHVDLARLADNTLYFRVTDGLRGLTRQRNFSMRFVTSDLVVFFDDDVVLQSDCLREMARVHRDQGERVAGVAGSTPEHTESPTRLWKIRKLLHIVPDLRPGSYSASGMSVPWFVKPGTDDLTEGDWLPGYSMMWKTKHARELGFCESFDSYAQSEDLDFSLRMRDKGALVLAGPAHLQHLPDPSGRPNHFKLGYMAIHNRYHIFKRTYPDRGWADNTQFIYTWTMDSVLHARGLVIPSQSAATLKHLAGRMKALFHAITGK
ncbi:glycosyltransferase family 2 protein [Novipirellula sp. SH528]|uniref:glycosyltransferase family 2 protein n=1 Tax=Novipirellula sp. SH528 TaxID=3454466 RepID=UPI003FA173C4